MPLKLSLKPGEAVIVNGAVLRNGERRGTVLLENHARVLREKDVLQPDLVRTADQRVYFAIMQLYLMGEHDGAIYDQVAAALTAALGDAATDEQRNQLLDISRACACGEIYQALSACRRYMKAVQAKHGVSHG